ARPRVLLAHGRGLGGRTTQRHCDAAGVASGSPPAGPPGTVKLVGTVEFAASPKGHSSLRLL
ncbi:MAG: hypothetical protein KJ626_12880, partial [Verrucomicrobia bacterium]|nr:hypothetical protein [Verrucomicrobiota bacterium]